MLDLPPPDARVRAIWPGASPENPWGTPGPARIAIVGEAPGEEEAWLKRPFVGASGIELYNQLRAAGIDPRDCLFTNVIDVQPPNNNFPSFCLRKEDLPRDYPIHIGPCITDAGNLYLHPDLLYNGARLRVELELAAPNVIIALGAKAAWAMLCSTEIGSLRGVVHRTVNHGRKCVPTWHPASVLRQPRQRPVAIVDLVKAAAESHFPEFRYDSAELWLRPTLEDLSDFEARFMRPGQLQSWDVETTRDEITCIGVSPAPFDRAIVVPFRIDPFKFKNPNGGEGIWRMTGNYWPTAGHEVIAWRWVKRLIEDPRYHILGQNFMYDIQRLLRYGINPRSFTEDTMLEHHSRYAEMPKALGFLGSVYTNFPSWKHLGARHATEEKRDA